MPKSILLAVLLFTSTFTVAGHAASCEETLRAVTPKFNFQLEREFAEATTSRTDFQSVFIVGALKIKHADNYRMTDDVLLQLFQEPNTEIRAIIPGRSATIVTFASSLFGVLNAACSEDVISIQMSQRLDGVAGMTVRN